MRCNRKKIVVVLVLSIVLLMLFSGYVAAQMPGQSDTGGSIVNAIQTIFGWVEVIDFERIGIEGDKSTIMAKFIIGIFIFALLSFAAKHIFAEHKSIGHVIAFVITLMVMIAVPGKIIQSLIATYSILAAAILFLIPIVAVFWMRHMLSLRLSGRPFHAASFIMLLFIWYIIQQFTDGMPALMETANAASSSKVSTVFGLLHTVLFVWVFIEGLLIFAGGSSGASALGSRALSAWSRGGGGVGAGGGLPPLKEEKKREEEEARATSQAADEKKTERREEALEEEEVAEEEDIKKEAEEDIAAANSLAGYLRALENLLERVKQSAGLTDGQRVRVLQKAGAEINNSVAKMNEWFSQIDKHEKKLEEDIRRLEETERNEKQAMDKDIDFEKRIEHEIAELSKGRGVLDEQQKQIMNEIIEETRAKRTDMIKSINNFKASMMILQKLKENMVLVAGAEKELVDMRSEVTNMLQRGLINGPINTIRTMLGLLGKYQNALNLVENLDQQMETLTKQREEFKKVEERITNQIREKIIALKKREASPLARGRSWLSKGGKFNPRLW